MCPIFNLTCTKVSNICKIIGCISRIDFVSYSLASVQHGIKYACFPFCFRIIDEGLGISIISEASTEMLCVCTNTRSIWKLLTVPEQFLHYVRVQCCAVGGRSCLGHEWVYNNKHTGGGSCQNDIHIHDKTQDFPAKHWNISLVHLIWTPWFRISQTS